jgi:4-hydroxyphenylpyruvate dioxygenase
MKHAVREIDLYEQNQITFLLNREERSLAGAFHRAHGPSISAMGWRFASAAGCARGGHAAWRARVHAPATSSRDGSVLPAIWGIGERRSTSSTATRARRAGSSAASSRSSPVKVAEKGFLTIDHLTNNVEKGTMQKWASFYKDVFGFTEVRYFDIKGVKTGLVSYALRSPDGSFCIPINEGTDKKSQINEYLEEYKGPGSSTSRSSRATS